MRIKRGRVCRSIFVSAPATWFGVSRRAQSFGRALSHCGCSPSTLIASLRAVSCSQPCLYWPHRKPRSRRSSARSRAQPVVAPNGALRTCSWSWSTRPPGRSTTRRVSLPINLMRHSLNGPYHRLYLSLVASTASSPPLPKTNTKTPSTRSKTSSSCFSTRSTTTSPEARSQRMRRRLR